MISGQEVLVIEDFSALGQISTVAAVTILQALDYTTAMLPTALLSTQTEGFGTPERLATNDWLQKTIRHWQRVQGLNFKGILVGYLGQDELVASINRLLKMTETTGPIFVDPVMGDEGKLYPGLSSDYVGEIRQLCQQATLITPNWTELCLLAGEEPSLPATQEKAQQLLRRLIEFEIKSQVIITGVKIGRQVGCVVPQRGDQFQFIGNPAVAGHFFGTGDTFAALLLGLLMSGNSTEAAVKKATQLIYTAIQSTAQEPITDRKYGLKLGHLIQQLTKTELN
ncbi:PfkB family carbohydrate kinase [Limosilactobacillus caecicola]|uniref:PfkB family carbohydrate kinase n=1 Tax=Limosilactobacillus caecicola TaxID=2941332 RepID=UPI00203BA5EA|nr:PfkB family carbohydrate kinase [Limosilactobacillus caecicola]